MKADEFVAALRSEAVDGLMEMYAQMFSNTPIENVTDAGFQELIAFWLFVDEPTRGILKKFIRLGSQNTLSSVLAVLDNTSSQFAEAFSLTAKSSDGRITDLSKDLLDEFWSQEETAGNANQRMK